MLNNLLLPESLLNNSIVVEVIGGLSLAVSGFLLIWFLRPRVKISPNIAKTTNNGKASYNIKVINRSYLFQLLDIKFELTMLKPIPTSKGMNIGIREINLESDHVWFLSRRKSKFSKDIYATYAIVITVKEDYDFYEFWKEQSESGAYFDLKVISKNNFSGITSINHEKFSHVSCVKKGVFTHGNSVEIVNHD